MRYSYDAAGLIAEKYVSGETGRKTLEEMLYGSVQAEETGVSGSASRLSGDGVRADGDATPGNGAAPALAGTATRTTTYIYDIMQENTQVISEYTDGRATTYTYGLERTAAYAGDAGNQVRMGYTYDARGSVIQADVCGVEDAGGASSLTRSLGVAGKVIQQVKNQSQTNSSSNKDKNDTEVPDYIRENRVPKDNETILKNYKKRVKILKGLRYIKMEISIIIETLIIKAKHLI